MGFAHVPIQIKSSKFIAAKPESKMKLNVFLAPQILFAATCAGAVFAYVYTNIDSIKEKQKASIEQVQTQQADSLKTVQEKQAADIKRIQAEQAANIAKARRVAEEGQKKR
eukprot:CAMPEP_0119040292 /NCGR_PEP_ID=MMETSP1177-20130426/10177_1 /TAXON_ID=2985 /ORGANISM="Ochromonas sp, Strain CCMP1899" /LENGTH=110 /DNA_ID=CAMNT_0007005205 /DNA_START=124 /DNA_END=456 /DNA_ORIENTATION=+